MNRILINEQNLVAMLRVKFPTYRDLVHNGVLVPRIAETYISELETDK